MRAVVLSHHFADTAHRRKLRELAGLGWSLSVAVPNGSTETDGPLSIVPVAAAGAADRPEVRRWSRRAVRRLLSDVRPDLVYIEEEPGTQAADVTVREARRLGIPAIVFGWESLPRNRPFGERRRYRRTLAGAAGVIGGNRLAEALLATEVPGTPTLSLPQVGVSPPSNVERRIENRLSIAYVGRLVSERGGDRLLRACGQLMGPWSLVIAGTGPEQESLEVLAERLGLAARTRWLGAQSREQVAGLWPSTDCVVMPSRATPTWIERWSPALVDAMAHGVAPIVSADGALAEVVGDAGLVFHDDEELLLRLQELVTQPARRQDLGQAARRRVLDRFVDGALARSLDTFWRDVLARRTAAAAVEAHS